MNGLSVIEKEFGDISEWSKAPDFWVSKPDIAKPFIDSLKHAEIRTIGRSAGGRDIIAIEYGEKEDIGATTDNLHSALAGSGGGPDPTKIFPESFYGKRRRKRPVLAIQGAIHGGELTGTVASLNMCKVMEDGKDLRGREWQRLRELALETRIVTIPWLNVDGAVRMPLANSSGAPSALCDRCAQGVSRDGTRYRYPEAKNVFPIPPEKTAFMGTYYNDAGVNLQYDFCVPRRQPETTAWMEYYLAERPDAVVIWHCNAGSMLSEPDYYLPPGFQLEYARLGGAVRQRLLREGHEIGRLSLAGLPAMGRPNMSQANAVYHACGAMPVMCELPAGTETCYFSNDEMLDIGLITLEEILLYAHRDGLRPYELWDKVKRTVP